MKATIHRSSDIVQTGRVQQVSGLFDVPLELARSDGQVG